MNLLVAMDDSEFAKKALRKAVSLAGLEPSTLVLFNVIPLPGAVEEMAPRLAEKIRRSGRAVLEEGKKWVKEKGIPVKIVLEEGVSPAHNIIMYAEENRIDLVVLGYRGKANLEKFLLGSVALRVVSHAPCSVLVVK
jgi:nucleotide-binding universal stress UspA family protein